MSNKSNSPFYIIQDFISPIKTEQVIDSLMCYEPDTDNEGFATKNTRTNDASEELIYMALQPYVPTLEQHYGITYKGTERVMFEWYPHGCAAQAPRCENASYVKRSDGSAWVRDRERDLTCVLFLSDYQDDAPFDSDYEVYGGKLEFPQHQFGFNPQRGTLIVFPSDPHFINVTADIAFGDMFLARFHIAATQPFVYDPKKFPGDYNTWLEQFA